MNKKLRVLFCMLFAAIAVFALALVACDQDNSGSSGSGSSAEETHTHTYSSDPTVSWVEKEDGTYDLTVTLTCDDSTCGETTSITATVTSEVTTAATKLAKGVRTYTGKYTYNGEEQVVTKEVEIPALATVYDAAYIETDGTGFTASEYWEGQYTIAEDTSIFDGFATTVGAMYWRDSVDSELEYYDTIATGYTFAGRLNIVSSTAGLTFTLENAATVTIYTNVNNTSGKTLSILSGSTIEGTAAKEFTVTDDQSGKIAGYSAELAAGTYTIYYGTSFNIYAIVVEGDGYTDGLWNYTATEGGDDEGGESGNNQFTLETETDYTFTAAEAGYYTFTISGDTDYASIYEGETSYDNWGTALLDVQSANSTSFEKYLEANGTITLYLTGSDGVTVTYTVSDTSGSGSGSSGSITLAAGDNEISLTADDAYNGVDSTFTATADGIYTFSIEEMTDAYIYVGSSTLCSYSNYPGGNLTVSFLMEEDDQILLTFYSNSYNAVNYTLNIEKSELTYQTVTADGDAITLNAYALASGYYTYNAYVSFTGTASTAYYLAIGGDVTYTTVSVVANGETLTGGDYNYNLTAVAGTNTVVITLKGYYVDYGSYTVALVTGTYTPVQTSVSALAIGDNSITLSSDDAYDGYGVTYNATADGVYTFSIGSDTTADVSIYSSQDSDYYSYRLYAAYGTTSASYVLNKDESLYILLCTASGSSGSYTLTIDKTDISYQTLSTEATTLSIYASATDDVYYAYVTYGTAGTYYMTLSNSGTYWANGATITVTNGTTEVTGENYNYNLTLAADDKIVIKYEGIYTSFTYSAALTSGTYVAKTTSINANTDNSGKIVEGDNAIVLSTSDATNGYVLSTFAASEDGVYTFTISSTSGALIHIATSEEAYKQNNYTRLYSYTTLATFELEAEDTLYFVFRTSSSSEGEYTLTLTISDLTSGANTITLTAQEAGDGVSYTYVVAADGYYTFSVASADGTTAGLDAYVEIYYSNNKQGALGLSNYSTDEFTGNESGISLTAGTVVTFKCYSNTYDNDTNLGAATTYVLTIAEFSATD